MSIIGLDTLCIFNFFLIKFNFFRWSEYFLNKDKRRFFYSGGCLLKFYFLNCKLVRILENEKKKFKEYLRGENYVWKCI